MELLGAGVTVALGERRSELVLFEEAYAASTRSQGAVLFVSGPVGTGKTALMQEMAAHAGRQGGPFFLVTASAGERARPFGVLDRLIHGMCAAGMTPPFPDGRPHPDRDFFAMMDRIGAVIQDFARGRPVVIGIDDIHFADEQSLRCLSYVIRRIEQSRVVIVLNECTSYERETADLRAEMLHLPYCHRIRLAALTQAGIAEHLTRHFGAVPDAASVRFYSEVSGGNPLLLHALIDDRIAVPEPADGEPGSSFRQAVLRILHRCSPVTAAVARSVAVLGDYAAPALIAELVGADIAVVRAGMRDLHEIGLRDAEAAEGFRHGHIRSAMLSSVPSADLSTLHGRAAEVLHASGAPAIAVAEHLIAAQDGGKAAWRVTILCEAAREAMAAGDVESAGKSLRYAVESSGEETQRAQAAVLAADAQWHADPSRAVRRLHGLRRDALAGLLTGPDILVVVNQLLWWGEFGEADELMRLSGLEGGGGSSLAQLWTLFRRTWPGSATLEEPGRPTHAVPALTHPLHPDHLRRSSEPLQQPPLAQSGPMAAVTYLSSAATSAYDAMTPGRADQMLSAIRAGTPLTPALYALVVLVQTGQLDEAAAWCDRLLKEDWIGRVPMRRVMIGTIQSVAALRSGDSETSLRGIREVLDVVPPPAWGVAAGLPLSVAVRAATDLGDAQSARSHLAAPVPPVMFDTPFGLPYLQALGRYHLAMGHRQSALAHFRSCTELLIKWGVEPAGIQAAIDWHHRTAAPTGPEVARPPADRGEDASAAAEAEPPWEGPSQEPAGPPESVRLTDAEQRVAALAAAGNTNRQIAESLFITVSTVEQHLTKIYRKLNVRSRSGLRRFQP
ncbi:AAA family ATPase [Actinoplanes sp. NPDC049548]|uniref:AAA family ATPase n=1 Tax=Actinoplanes sp. NPDC049548 TaxID=3155152 RepID=UPI00341CE14B